MALINCPECKKRISDRAIVCPHCGLPSDYFSYSTEELNPTEPVDTNVKQKNNLSNKQEKSPKKVAQSKKNALASLPVEVEADKPQKENSTKKKRITKKALINEELMRLDKDQNILRNILVSFNKDYGDLLSGKRFIAESDRKAFYSRYEKHHLMLKEPLVKKYIKNNTTKLCVDFDEVNSFINKINHLVAEIEVVNEKFISRKLIEYKRYFNGILKKVDANVLLDEEQRRAVLTDEDYCLLIAGAGAGKTTTMAAKVKYLIDKCGERPEDIIVISYTNKAVDELKDRICDKLKIPVKVTTFHAFGYDIIQRVSDQPPQVNSYAYSIIFEMLEKSIFSNKELMKKLVLFFGYYFDIPETALKFNNLDDYHKYKADMDFETLRSRLGEYVRSVASKRTRDSRTIRGEYLRSVQEVQIANFLYIHGIDYEYEKPYLFSLGKRKKKYTPDFYIEQGENKCYVEHFGLSESGRSYIYSPQDIAKYMRGIDYKKRLHEHYNTPLIATWSSYNDKRPLLVHLKEELEKRGFILNQRSDEEIYRKLVESNKDKYIVKLILFIMEFIEKYKSNGYNASGFEVLRSKTDNVRNLLFLDIVEEVYSFYQDRLKSNNQIDFADMINDAEYLLREIEGSNVELNYRYIIIDEFQDIARQRFNLTKRLADITGAKVVAVGDDWQSIYAFAGSDITLFTKFLELMGAGKELQITRTYRNSQELIDIAGSFVQKNPLQIRKRLISPKRLENPIVINTYDDTTAINKAKTSAIIKVIGDILNEYGEHSSILLIGRYGFDRYNLLNSGEFAELQKGKLKCKKHPKADITYMTAHSSKGLGYDNVIIINMIESKFGFPSQVEIDPIMKMVIHEDYHMPFAEERRLFYVALTRTKNRVYIVAPINRPSQFLIELIKDHNIPCSTRINRQIVDKFNYRCPICGFPLKYEFNKNYGLSLYICTNDPEICDFMTNDKSSGADIFKCPECDDGYMIVKKNLSRDEKFYGCTNYNIPGKMCSFARPLVYGTSK